MRRLRNSVGLLAILMLASLQPMTQGCGDGCDLEITTGALPNATVGLPFETELDSDCGGDAWFLSSGLLPPGISLQDDGDLFGTPLQAGSYSFTVGVVEIDNGFVEEEATKGFLLVVRPASGN